MEKKPENTLLPCGKVLCDHTGTFYYDLRKEEYIIDLALKMAMTGMNEEFIVDV